MSILMYVSGQSRITVSQETLLPPVKHFLTVWIFWDKRRKLDWHSLSLFNLQVCLLILFYWPPSGKKKKIHAFLFYYLFPGGCHCFHGEEKIYKWSERKQPGRSCQAGLQLPQWTPFLMNIVNHSNSRGFFAFVPDMRRHESSENCQKCCSPFPLQYISFFRMALQASVKRKTGSYSGVGLK